MDRLIPLTAEEEKTLFEMLVGKTICPICGQEVLVTNDSGRNGNPAGNYLVSHFPNLGDHYLCIGSEEMLKNL